MEDTQVQTEITTNKTRSPDAKKQLLPESNFFGTKEEAEKAFSEFKARCNQNTEAEKSTSKYYLWKVMANRVETYTIQQTADKALAAVTTTKGWKVENALGGRGNTKDTAEVAFTKINRLSDEEKAKLSQ